MKIENVITQNNSQIKKMLRKLKIIKESLYQMMVALIPSII